MENICKKKDKPNRCQQYTYIIGIYNHYLSLLVRRNRIIRNSLKYITSK